MPWLEKLDTRSQTWAWPNRWVYLAVKWYLAALGGFLVFRLFLERIGVMDI